MVSLVYFFLMDFFLFLLRPGALSSYLSEVRGGVIAGHHYPGASTLGTSAGGRISFGDPLAKTPSTSPNPQRPKEETGESTSPPPPDCPEDLSCYNSSTKHW